MEAWRKNLAVLFCVQLLSTAGFSLIFPFLPLYVREIGTAGAWGSLEFWAALVFSSQAAAMMLFSPVWGALADRHGRKVMLERATLGGALLLFAMGFVQNAEQLVLLRTLQGAVTGVVAAANALVAAQTPREHSGFALGLLNMARWTGTAGGPLVEGLLAEAYGFRQSFWITGVLLGVAGVAVVLFVREDFRPAVGAGDPGFWEAFWRGYRSLFRAPGMSGLYGLTFLRSLGATLTTPILALFVLQLHGGVAGAAALTGVVIGASALASAVSAVYLGRLGDRIGHTRVLIGSAVAAMVLYAPQALVQSVWQLVLLQALGGLAVGGLVPSVAALLNLWSPGGSQGATYGLDNSMQASGRVVAPLVAATLVGLAGAWLPQAWLLGEGAGYRVVFMGAAGVYALIALAAAAVVRGAARRGAAEE